jgi:hypothetical protein
MLGGALLLQSCERPAITPATEPAMGSSEETASRRPATLTRAAKHVRDGDTIEVAGKPIRLQGLNCNERGTALGDAATTTMSQIGGKRRGLLRAQWRDDVRSRSGHLLPGEWRGPRVDPDPARHLWPVRALRSRGPVFARSGTGGAFPGCDTGLLQEVNSYRTSAAALSPTSFPNTVPAIRPLPPG